MTILIANKYILISHTLVDDIPSGHFVQIMTMTKVKVSCVMDI